MARLPHQPDPRRALDYPVLADEVWVIWHSNGNPWPAADRRLAYLSKERTHSTKGWALWTSSSFEAKAFSDEATARAWLAKQEEKRGTPYGANVTTVEQLKRECGYA